MTVDGRGRRPQDELLTAIAAAQLVVWLTVGGARTSRDEVLTMAWRRSRTEMMRRAVRGAEEVAHKNDTRAPRVVVDRGVIWRQTGRTWRTRAVEEAQWGTRRGEGGVGFLRHL